MQPGSSTRSLFRLAPASDATLLTLRPEGRPSAKTFDIRNLESSSTGLFRPKVASLPEIGTAKESRSRGHSTSSTIHNPEASTSSMRAPGLATSSSDPGILIDQQEAKPSRTQKYYQALLQAETRRNEANRKAAEAKRKAEAEAAAAAAAKQFAALNKISQNNVDSSETEEEDEDAEASGDDVGPLVPYDGTMKLDIEVVVMRAPGEKKVSSEADQFDHEASSTPTSMSSISRSTPRLDFSDELQALQEEMQGMESDGETTDTDDLPAGLREKRLLTIMNNPNPRLTLGIAGTVFFMPEAERYANGPSLPPPPPPSLMGRRRLRLKPRLPLDISNHRYRDEHPFVRPEVPWSPDLHDRSRFERKVRAYDFYDSCCMSLTQLPQQSFAREERKHRRQFGEMVDKNLRKSLAWKMHVHREKLKRRAELEAQSAGKDNASAVQVPGSQSSS